MFMHNGLVLYENLGRYIYVNRGSGFMPIQSGIMPEITVIELKKG
jgi:predicted MPP superfamily phosphohydrolase